MTTLIDGFSDSRFRITEEGRLEFFGTLSLENNGGFASVGTSKQARTGFLFMAKSQTQQEGLGRILTVAEWLTDD